MEQVTLKGVLMERLVFSDHLSLHLSALRCFILLQVV
jgi:hypothetical protein